MRRLQAGPICTLSCEVAQSNTAGGMDQVQFLRIPSAGPLIWRTQLERDNDLLTPLGGCGEVDLREVNISGGNNLESAGHGDRCMWKEM